MSGTDLKQRLVAILAADAAGYSRLMSTDERGTVAALDAARAVFRSQIESNQGRVIDMAGDSVLAVFETATGAVSAALAVQTELGAANDGKAEDPRMRFRIGIHLGDVMEKTDGSIYGDGVNIAARLQALAEPGGVTVSESIRTAVKGKVPASFEDQGEQTVKNIADPVRVLRMVAGGHAMPAMASPLKSFPALPDKPSIAVLPFNNMSGDPEQEFFADGMCEDIITLLSSVPNLLVIARNSTFAYKGTSPDVRRVAQELGVRYVLEGSVRKSGQRVRVTAQFIDAQLGTHIWAEKYDRQVEDIFDVQDEVAQGIAASLQSRLLNAELGFVRRRPPEAVDAWGNVVQAKVKLFAYRHADLDDAEPFARQAIAIDPNYGEALAILGHILSWRSYNRWTDDWYQAAKDAAAFCERALKRAPHDAGVLTDVGSAYWFLGRFVKSVPLLQQANTRNPNSAIACSLLGQGLSSVGRAQEGVVHCQRAFRLSPKDPLEHLFHANLAIAEFFAGLFDLARQSALRSLEINPDLVGAMLYCAAACVRLGRQDEARAMLSKTERLGSSWAIDNLFRPRTEGTIWTSYTDAIRQVMDREPRI